MSGLALPRLPHTFGAGSPAIPAINFTVLPGSPKHCIWQAVGPAFLLTHPQGWLSHDAQMRAQASFLHSPLHIAPRVAAQTRGIFLAFDGNRILLLQNHRPRHGPCGSTSQDLAVALGGITSYSHQAAPHYLQVSTSASLHCTHPSASFSLISPPLTCFS